MTRQKRKAGFGNERRRTLPTIGLREQEPRHLRPFPDDVEWFLYGPFAVVLGVAGLFLPTLIGLWWTAVIIIAVGLAVVAWRTKRTKQRRLFIWITIAVLLISSAVTYARKPSPEEVQVDEQMEAIRTADGWASPPVMYPSGRDFVVDHFDAFDPDRWHSWDELTDDPQVSDLSDVVNNASVFSFGSVVTAGYINGGQQVGGSLLLQLQPLDHAGAAWIGKNADLPSLIPDESDQQALLAHPVKSSPDAHMLLFCLMTPRPFINESAGYYWVVKGVVVAVGHAFRGDGATQETAYMICSTGERFHR